MAVTTRRFNWLLAAVVLLGLFQSGYLLPTTADSRSPTSPGSIQSSFSSFVWYGRIPVSKTRMMLIVSKSGTREEVLLTGYALREFGVGDPVRKFELGECSFSVIEGMKVYPDPKTQVTYVAVTGGGASTAGVWVVRLSRSGIPETLFMEMSRGEPSAHVTESCLTCGYSFLSLIRASAVVNCHSMVTWAALRSRSQAAILLSSVSASGIRRERHCRDKTDSSVSAILSQLPCSGV